MGYYDGNWGIGEWLAMIAMMLLFWGLVIGLVVWAVRSFRSAGQRPDTEHGHAARPDEVLAERYARGDIDGDEFLRRRELLDSTSGSRTPPRRTP